MKLKKYSLITSLLLSIGLSSQVFAADPTCEIDETIRFGGMNWESNLVLTDVQRFIIEQGYGCKTEVLPTETLPALAALQRGDLEVNTEIWLNSMNEAWEKAVETGKVKKVNDFFEGREDWFIPKYVAERFPDLKTASDLKKYKDEFEDPENPNKGRIYGCPAGWACEIVSTNLFKSLDLDDDFVLYSPGTGASQKAAISSDYKRKKNIAFYYWYPTPLVGSLDLVKLELPEYDEDKHHCLTKKDCDNPEPTAYPENPVFTALNTDFMEKAPKLVKFFENNSIDIDDLNETLAHMDEEGERPEETAEWFLKNKQDVWTNWVSEEVAERVKAKL